MVYARRRKNPYGRRSFGTKRRVPRKMVGYTKPRMPSYMPLNKKVGRFKLRYAEETVTLTPSMGSVATYSFRANSLFDPNYSGVGHQPLTFDQIAVLYDHYTVTGAKIRAVFYCEDASTTYGVVCGIKVDDNGGISGNMQNIMEHSRNTHWKHMRSNANGAGPAMCMVTHTFSARKFFGIKDPVDNETVGASCTANPTDVAFFNIFYGHPDGLTTPPACRVDVFIEFNAIFAEPKDLQSS